MDLLLTFIQGIYHPKDLLATPITTTLRHHRKYNFCSISSAAAYLISFDCRALPPRNSLLGIPLELRLQIYSYLVHPFRPLFIDNRNLFINEPENQWEEEWKKVCKLFRTNRLLNKEITDLWCRKIIMPFSLVC